jgi:hypothetical protein
MAFAATTAIAATYTGAVYYVDKPLPPRISCSPAPSRIDHQSFCPMFKKRLIALGNEIVLTKHAPRYRGLITLGLEVERRGVGGRKGFEEFKFDSDEIAVLEMV